MTSIRRLGWTTLALFALFGCEPATPPISNTPVADTGTTPKAPTTEAPASVKLTDEQVAEIKKLPADEQPIALAQKICPVSGDPLGGEMGIPIKQTIGDKTFYICCGSCEKKVKTKPDEVLAELAKLKK